MGTGGDYPRANRHPPKKLSTTDFSHDDVPLAQDRISRDSAHAISTRSTLAGSE